MRNILHKKTTKATLHIKKFQTIGVSSYLNEASAGRSPKPLSEIITYGDFELY